MPKAITAGDVRPGLVKDHRELLEKAMNKSNPKKDKPYYIMMVSRWDGDKIKTTALVMDDRFPIDLLSSILYEVDPISGKYEMVYCKPKDVPTGNIILSDKRTAIQDIIATDASNSFTPLIH